MKLRELIKRLEYLAVCHGDLPVYRYSRNEHPPIESATVVPNRTELTNVFLEAHKETPQMFDGYEKVVELK